MSCALGIDIGGTAVKMGVLSVDGVLQCKTSIPVSAPADEVVHERIVRCVEGLLAEAGFQPCDVVGVGVDVPGPVDSGGRVGMLPNLTLDVEALLQALRNAFPQANAAILNDANAAALGELWKGAAQGVDSFAMVAIGTGVGGGLVVGGQLVAGAFGAGGEFGHITVNRAEPEPCGCGRFGCLEQYASATGIVRTYLQECAKRGTTPVSLSGPTDTLSVFNACQAGDQAAQAAVSGMADCLGYALAQASVVADPALYLIGGGVSAGWSLFGDALRAAYTSYCLKVSRPAVITPAALGNDAALYGSAYSALQSHA